MQSRFFPHTGGDKLSSRAKKTVAYMFALTLFITTTNSNIVFKWAHKSVLVHSLQPCGQDSASERGQRIMLLWASSSPAVWLVPALVVQTTANFADAGTSVFGSVMCFSAVYVLLLRFVCLSHKFSTFCERYAALKVAVFSKHVCWVFLPPKHKRALKNANTSEGRTFDYWMFRALVNFWVKARILCVSWTLFLI